MPRAFVLSAGGSLGDFEVGALRFLYNRGIRPEIVCGSSVGAINGAAIAQGPRGLDKLESIWLSMVLQSDMYTDRPWVDLLPAAVKGLLRDLLHVLTHRESIICIFSINRGGQIGFHEEPRSIVSARCWISSASEGICLAPLTRSRMY
jgi:predicted acylesterase/phospholipase RssA